MDLEVESIDLLYRALLVGAVCGLVWVVVTDQGSVRCSLPKRVGGYGPGSCRRSVVACWAHRFASAVRASASRPLPSAECPAAPSTTPCSALVTASSS